MNKIEIDVRTDEAGSVRIRLPHAPAHRPVRIVVEWEDFPVAPGLGWPQGWIEATAGSLNDPTFLPQPPVQP